MSRSLICCDTHHSLDLKVPSGSSASGSGSRSGSVCSASSALPSGTLEVLWLDEIRGIRKLHLQLAVAPDLDDLANRSTRNKIMLATPCHCVSAPASPPRSIHHLPLSLSQGLDLRCCCRRLDLRLRAGQRRQLRAAWAAGRVAGVRLSDQSLPFYIQGAATSPYVQPTLRSPAARRPIPRLRSWYRCPPPPPAASPPSSAPGAAPVELITWGPKLGPNGSIDLIAFEQGARPRHFCRRAHAAFARLCAAGLNPQPVLSVQLLLLCAAAWTNLGSMTMR